MKIGFGYDSHRFDPERTMVLGGVEIPDVPGLAGFSDGDAVAHAVIDAILGAACLGDVGRHFPPGEERWRNADSMELLSASVALLRGEGFGVGNVDVTVVTERPKIAPFSDLMRLMLAERLGVDVGVVSVKGKSNEGLGWIGAGEGLAVYAVATVMRIPEVDSPPEEGD